MSISQQLNCGLVKHLMLLQGSKLTGNHIFIAYARFTLKNDKLGSLVGGIEIFFKKTGITRKVVLQMWHMNCIALFLKIYSIKLLSFWCIFLSFH